VPAPDYTALAAAQRRRVADVRGNGIGHGEADPGQLEAAAGDPTAPLMEPIIEAVRRGDGRGDFGRVAEGVGVYRPGERHPCSTLRFFCLALVDPFRR